MTGPEHYHLFDHDDRIRAIAKAQVPMSAAEPVMQAAPGPTLDRSQP